MTKANTATRAGQLPTLMLFAVAIIWGSGFIASQMALDAQVSPELLMFGRFSIAALTILLLFWSKLKTALKRGQIRNGILVGLFLFLGFYVQIVGLQYTTPSNNAFITSTNVVMVPFIWWLLTRKRPSKQILLSSLLCLGGIGILSINFSNGISFSPGDLLTLLCAFFFACQIVATGRLAAQMDTVTLVFLQFATAAVLSLFAMLVTGVELAPLATAKGLGSVVYLGLFSTCLCYCMQTAAQKQVPASKAAIILSTEALFGTLLSVLVGYELLSANMLVGGGVILLSLVLTELPLRGSQPQLQEEGI